MSDYSFWHGDVRHGLGLVCLFNYSILQWQQAVWAVENKRAVTKVERVCLMACWKMQVRLGGKQIYQSISAAFSLSIYQLCVCVCAFRGKVKACHQWQAFPMSLLMKWHSLTKNKHCNLICLLTHWCSYVALTSRATMCWLHSTRQCTVGIFNIKCYSCHDDFSQQVESARTVAMRGLLKIKQIQ